MTYISTDVEGYDGLEVRYIPDRVWTSEADGSQTPIPASVTVELVGTGLRSYLSLSISDARFLLDELGKALATHDATEAEQCDTTGTKAVAARKAA